MQRRTRLNLYLFWMSSSFRNSVHFIVRIFNIVNKEIKTASKSEKNFKNITKQVRLPASYCWYFQRSWKYIISCRLMMFVCSLAFLFIYLQKRLSETKTFFFKYLPLRCWDLGHGKIPHLPLLYFYDLKKIPASEKWKCHQALLKSCCY